MHVHYNKLHQQIIHVLFADHDLSPLSLVHSFTVTPLLFSEPA